MQDLEVEEEHDVLLLTQWECTISTTDGIFTAAELHSLWPGVNLEDAAALSIDHGYGGVNCKIKTGLLLFCLSKSLHISNFL